MWQTFTREGNDDARSGPRHPRQLLWVVPALVVLLLGSSQIVRPAVAAVVLTVAVTGPATAQVGTQVNFSGSVQNPQPNCTPLYSWTFSDGGSTNTGANSAVSHTYTQAGQFTVNLTVSDGCGDVGTATPFTVNVGGTGTTGSCTTNTNNPITTSINPANATISAGTPVSFFGITSGTASTVTYNWSFGDGGSAAGISVSHAFTAAGTYTVILNVADAGSGRTGCASAIVTVTGTGTGGTSTNPNIRVAPNGPYTGNTGQAINFGGFATSFNQANGQNATITSYQWNFGDNTNGSNQFVSHTYTAAGTYTVTLTVTDSTGQTGSATTTATIGGGGTGGNTGGNTGTGSATANGVTANTGGPYTGSSGTPITFNGTATTANSGATIASCVWSFGDNSTSAPCQGATHTYNSNGTYTAVVTVTDSTGAVVAASTGVTISGGSRTVNLVAGCNNVSSTFPDGTSTGTLANGINAQSALLSIWKLTDPATAKYRGYFPGATQASDLPTLNRLDAIFICVNGSATLTEPSA